MSKPSKVTNSSMEDSNIGCDSASGNLASRRRGGRRISQRFMTVALTILLLLVYFAFSIGLTFYQKNLLKVFKFPLTCVIFHLIIKFIFAGLCRLTYTCYTGQPRVTVEWKTNWRRILPPGLAAGLDIGFSQWSLEFITITLYTMSKSSALLFILFFAIIFKLEEMNYRVVLIVLFIAGGLTMFTYKYTQFHLFGFILVMSASVLSGLRWTLSQMVMQKAELGLSNPVDMVYYIQPWMIVGLLPLAIVMEGSDFTYSQYGFNITNWSTTAWMWFRIFIGAVIAYLMECSEYLVICFTSSLNFSIAGVAKEIITLSLAIGFGHEVLSSINVLGLLLCVVGIILHVALKAHHMQSTKHHSVSPQQSNAASMTVPLLSKSVSEQFSNNA